MIYSIIPLEDIFSSPFIDNENQNTMMCQMSGMQLEVKPLDFSRGQIVRIVSGPLEVYLNPKYCPGEVIPLPLE